MTSAADALGQWTSDINSLVRDDTPLKQPAKGAKQFEAYPSTIPICLRGANGPCRWITINSACLFAVAGGTALKVANYTHWHNDILSLVTSLAIGGGLELALKINMPPHIEEVMDEMKLFLAPLFFQAITQSEINTPSTPGWKETWFSAIFVTFAAVVVSHGTNLLSADPALFGTGEQGNYRPFLEGDCRKTKAFMKVYIPLMTTSVALFVLGIVTKNSLLTNLGVLFGLYSNGQLAAHFSLSQLQNLRKNITSQIRGDSLAPKSYSEVVSGAYKVIPVAMPFLVGFLAAWNRWWGFAIGGMGVGVATMISRDTFQWEQPVKEHTTRPRSFRHLLVDALLPFSRPLLHSHDRAQLSTSRKVIDTVKGVFCLSALIGINLWAKFWFDRNDKPGPRAQLISAAWSTNISYLLTCSIEALCQGNEHPFANSLKFLMDNRELAGLLYLALFSHYLENVDSTKAIFFWMVLAYLLMSSMVSASKRGKMNISAPAVVFYLWTAYTMVQFARSNLIG